VDEAQEGSGPGSLGVGNQQTVSDWRVTSASLFLERARLIRHIARHWEWDPSLQRIQISRTLKTML
jgi:hypothetical protein